MEKISFDDVEKMINNFQSLHKTMHYMMMEKTEKFNISPDQTRLLFILQNHQNINQNALAKKLNITCPLSTYNGKCSISNLKIFENTTERMIIIQSGFRSVHKTPRTERLYLIFTSLATNSDNNG